jgi:uncharacterized membrane protein
MMRRAMRDEASTSPIHERSGAVLSAESALRLVLVLLALWTILSGLALTFFQDASDATIGGGLKGDQGAAAQRLLGVHLLVLAPIYGMLAWEPRRFRLLMWLPYAAQGGVVLVTLFDIVSGKRNLPEGMLPLVVACIFLVLLLYVTFAREEPIEAEVVSSTAILPAPEPPPEPAPSGAQPPPA